MTNKQAVTEFFNYCELMRRVPTTSNLFTHTGATNLWYVSYDSNTMVLYSYSSSFPVAIYDRGAQLYYIQCFKPTRTTSQHERLVRDIALELAPLECLRYFYYVPTNYAETVGQIQKAIDDGICQVYGTYQQCKEAFRL